MDTLIAENVLKKLWEMYGVSIENDLLNVRTTPEKKIEEFFFVVLGGFGISYELNQSALKVLRRKGYLDSSLYKNKTNLETTILRLREEFDTKQFEPRTKSNELRKYRFVESKPVNVTLAGHWLWNECSWNLDKILEDLGSQSRQWLCQCPGFGMKSASWFLRNIGFNNDYAVFDVHILRFLSQVGIEIPDTLTEKAYLYLEGKLREICYNIGVNLGKMDYLLWLLGRSGYLRYVG